jgi:uncharacterized damage-inducible protein DinB
MTEPRSFTDEDLSGALFERVHLNGARFRSVDLTGATLHGVDLIDVTVTGDVHHLVINDVDVAPLVTAELDRRHPGRAAMRPEDADGFRHGWELVSGLWEATVERARALEARRPGALQESVAGEWSFVETLRHLAFAETSWVARAIEGDLAPWHPLELPWDEASFAGLPRDRDARPDLDVALALRADRQARVARLLATLTDERLDEVVTPAPEAVWPPPRPIGVRECLLIVLNEEFQHRLYAERDLAALETLGVPEVSS